MDLKLAGRIAMITGPAKGMGAAITKAFATEGSRWRWSAAIPKQSNRWPEIFDPPEPRRSSCRAT